MSAPHPDKAQEAVYPPQQPGGYPPQQNPGYPPQQNPGYPPQQNPGYPPQQQGYPAQGAPPSYPDQGQAQYTGQQTVIVGAAPQTTMIVRQSQPQPNDYLAFAIFVTVCCCLPFGIVGIIKSMDVRNRYTSGDYAGAEQASRSAKNWSLAGLITGIVLEVLGVILIIVYYVVIISVYTTAATNSFDFDLDNYNFDLDNYGN